MTSIINKYNVLTEKRAPVTCSKICRRFLDELLASLFRSQSGWDHGHVRSSACIWGNVALMAVLALLYIANHTSTFFSVRGSTYNQSWPICEIVKSTRNHKVDFSEGSDECLSSSDSLLFDTSIASAAEATVATTAISQLVHATSGARHFYDLPWRSRNYDRAIYGGRCQQRRVGDTAFFYDSSPTASTFQWWCHRISVSVVRDRQQHWH